MPLHQKSLRIAIADDEVDMRDYLRKVLERWGHQVVCVANNGETLAAECQITSPDLVITDLKMPNGDGISAISEIWSKRQIPIIVITAFAQGISDWLREQPLLTAVLIKPIKTADLEPVVAKIAGQIQ